MTEPADLVGTSGVAYRVSIERGKIREFAAATKAKSSSYRTDPAPVAPPTFLAATAFWAEPDSSPLRGMERNWSRILHGEQEYIFYGSPPAAGDELVAQQTVENVFRKEGKRGGSMTFTILVTEFRDQAGRLVAEARGTAIETSRPTPEGPA